MDCRVARYELGFSSYKTVLGVGSVLRWVLLGGWFGPSVGFAWVWLGPLEYGAKKPVDYQQAFWGLF